MVDVKISALGAIGTVAGEDLVAIIDDPSGTPVSKKATIDQIKTYIGGMTASSTATFTNKTFDAEGTGNSISNIDVADLKSGVLDTDISSVSGSDDTIPSAKAVKTYVDAQIATEDTLAELNDTTITSVGDNEILQYNNSSSVWENQTLAEAGISPVAGSSSITTVGTIGTGTWQGTAIASAYIAGDAIDGTKIADNAVANEHLADDSVGIAELSATGSSITTKFLRGDNTWQTVTTSPAFNDLSDVTLTSPVQGHILYRNASGWVNLAPGTSGHFLKTQGAGANPIWATGGGGNHTEQGFDVYTTHTPTATTSDGIAYMFARKIDSNNDGLFITLWKNGASQEVQIA
jgi:hypothetical protein